MEATKNQARNITYYLESMQQFVVDARLSMNKENAELREILSVKTKELESLKKDYEKLKEKHMNLPDRMDGTQLTRRRKIRVDPAVVDAELSDILDAANSQ